MNTFIGGVHHFMSGEMARQVAARRTAMAADKSSGWKPSDIIIPVTLYGDGVEPTDQGGNSVDVKMLTVLNFSPELQEKPWSKICLGYINCKKVLSMSNDELIKYIIR
jgi:hypothetical protein